MYTREALVRDLGRVAAAGGSLRVALMQAATDLRRADRIVTEQGVVFEMSSAVLDGLFAAKSARVRDGLVKRGRFRS